MSDNISRQAAMAYPLSWEHYDKEHGDTKFICGVESYREYIEHLPSVAPKTGEWIKATGMMPPEFHGHHCCSACGNFANMEPPFGNREGLSKFCPNCGAKMENGEA